MHRLKLISVGVDIGVALPSELLARLNLKKGDVLHLRETPDGFLLTGNPAFENQMESAREIMNKRRKVLRKLAR